MRNLIPIVHNLPGFTDIGSTASRPYFPVGPTAANLARKEKRKKEGGKAAIYFLWHLSVYDPLISTESFLLAEIKSYTSLRLSKILSIVPYPKFESGKLWAEFYQYTLFI